MSLLATIASYLLTWTAGAITTLGVLALLRQPRPQDDVVEGIDGLDRALNTAGRDLPTQRLPQPGAGTVYAGSHRRKGQGWWLACLGRSHARRVHEPRRDLP